MSTSRKLSQLNRLTSGDQIASERLLGYQDSNLEWRYQKPLCCQLHHTPMTFSDIHISCDVNRVSSRDRDYQRTQVFLQIARSRGCIRVPPNSGPRIRHPDRLGADSVVMRTAGSTR